MRPKPVIGMLSHAFFKNQGVGLSQLPDVLFFVPGRLGIDWLLDNDPLTQAISNYDTAC
jgi:hypothetical protein